MLPLMTSRTYLTAESDLKMYRDYMNTARELGLDVFANYVLFEEAADQLTVGVNEKFFCVERFANVYELQTQMPRGFVELFHPVDGRYPIEAAITSRAILAPFMQRLLWHRMHQVPAIPVFIMEPHVETSGETGAGCHITLSDAELMMRSMGYASCRTFFSTERQRRGAMKEALRWLSAEAVGRIEKNSWVVPHPIRCDEIDEVMAGTPKRDKFTVAFMGRYNHTKNWEFVFETLRKYYAMGKPVDLIGVTPLAGAVADVSKYSEFTKYVDLPRTDYMRTMCSAHASLNASLEEGFCITVHEQIYAGQVVLLPRRDWVKALLREHWDTYPWLYTGEEEAIAKLEMVRTDYASARASMEPYRKFVRDNADAKATVRKVFSEVGQAIEDTKRNFTVSDKSRELIRRSATDLGPMFKLSKVKEMIKKGANQPGIIFNRAAPLSTFPGQQLVFWTLKEMGYEDAGEADPVLVAPGVGRPVAQERAVAV